jgi:uncharacterized membrane protein (UPF0182 family)
MRDTQVFYNKEDLWSIPARPGGGPDRPMGPYRLILRLPGEPKEEFVLLIPFNPSKKGQLPELKRVIVGFGDLIAMEETSTAR